MVALESPLTAHRAAGSARPLRVGVLVDLVRSPQSGGHVKCWERLAQAATGMAGELDLTVHFNGPSPTVEAVGDNVRFVIERPVFSTARLPFLSHVPDHTDLAPWHRRLAPWLRRYDVIHTTDAFFAYARTATRTARRLGVPLVTSLHTNTPEYSRIYTRLTVERLFGPGRLGRWLIDDLAIDRRVERSMLERLRAHQRLCAHVLVSRPAELVAAQSLIGPRAGLLRRGIDRQMFTPALRDRGWLQSKFGIPPDRVVVMFAGRLDHGKNVMLLADAVGILIDGGAPIHLLCAGEGDLRAALGARLGQRVSLPGCLAPPQLAQAYAAADLFALPSKIEESANVVLEALASGLPVLVAAESGMGRAIIEGKTGLALDGGAPAEWARAIEALCRDSERRLRMARAARHHAETRLPSWRDVLADDLLPRWRDAAGLPALG